MGVNITKEATLTPCPFSETVLFSSSLGHMTAQARVLDQGYNRHKFPPVEQASTPLGKGLVTPITAMSLWHQWARLPWQVGLVVHRVLK